MQMSRHPHFSPQNSINHLALPKSLRSAILYGGVITDLLGIADDGNLSFAPAQISRSLIMSMVKAVLSIRIRHVTIGQRTELMVGPS
ncbi:MAG: hypothetical protein C4576_34480 [Desulfobacteraceae bacterium]|nr:MAG: hypothetical protein C4576_34480 [Desulfobacteraceae bacterium]